MTFKSFLDISNFKYNFEHSNWMDWERVAKSLPELLNSGIIRKVIDNLPRVELEGLEEGAIKRAYTILTFIAHAYIRGNSQEEVIKKLPEKISSVWIEAGNLLGVPPVATYAATVLYNFKYKSELRGPEDFEIEFTFTGTEDEKWFYAVSAAIDTQSEILIKNASKLLDQNGNLDEIGVEITRSIEEMTRILNKMYEKCRPEIFYCQVRRYLAGWLNDPELPDGLIYDLGNDRSEEQMKLAGGSAAQNPTVQLLDILLGVKHERDTEDLMISGYNMSGCPRMNYLGAMRTYMPTEHREYLNNFERRMCQLEKFKETEGYQSCVKALINFRSEHIKMVTLFIVCQSKKGNPLGTGGSNPIPFLKKCRNETEKCLNNK